MTHAKMIRLALCAGTAISTGAFSLGEAQTAATSSAPVNLNLGSVVATGSGGGYVAPSATGTLNQAQKLQKLAPNIIVVQPESVMRTLPDQNVSENLQHVPGVSLQEDSGFGRYLNIRGLAEDLNATSYAGINLPATNTNADPSGGSRGVALDFLPPGVIGGTEVINSLTPDISATGLGGVVNLLPPSLPDDGKPHFEATLGGGFTNLQNHAIYNGDFTGGAHFSIPGMKPFANAKPFSFIVSYGNFDTSPGIYDVEESYTNPTVQGAPSELNTLQLRNYMNNRNEQGYTGEVDFDPNDSVHLFLRGLQSADVETINKTELYLQNLDATAVDAAGNPIGTVTQTGVNQFTSTGANLNKYYENSVEKVSMAFFEGGGRVTLDNFATLNFHTSYAEGSDRFTRDYVTNFGSNDQNLTINYDTSNTAIRNYTITNAAGVPVDPTNPNNYSFTDTSNFPSRSHDRIYDNGLNAAIPTAFLNTNGEFKFGGDITLRSRNVLRETTFGTPLAGPYSLAGVTQGNGSLNDYNHYPVGPNLNYTDFFSVPTAYALDNIGNPQAFQHDKENIYAGFAQETASYGPINVLAGVRVEDTSAAYTGYGSSTDAAGNTVVNATPTTRSKTYVNVFPSVQLRYSASDALVFRAAYSTGIARPGFQQINPAVSTTVQGGQGGRNLTVTGNPALNAQTGSSYDLTAEYYTSHDGLLAADLFLKDFSNYIVATNSNTPTTTFQTYSNINGATAKGIELQAVQMFYFLPNPFDGLGVDSNLTYVDATAEVHQGQGRSILPQSSPLTYNVTGIYDKGPVNFRLSASYVSRNLFSIGQDRSTDVFTPPRFRLDASMSYDVSKNLQVFFEAKNLTNTVLEFTQSSSTAYPIQREFYGQDFLFGVHYKM